MSKVDFQFQYNIKKHAIKIYLEKFWKNGSFTLLNEPIKPYKLP